MSKINYGKQNIEEGTVEVYVDNKVVICDMYQDEDGDFLFYLKGDPYSVQRTVREFNQILILRGDICDTKNYTLL